MCVCVCRGADEVHGYVMSEQARAVHVCIYLCMDMYVPTYIHAHTWAQDRVRTRMTYAAIARPIMACIHHRHSDAQVAAVPIECMCIHTYIHIHEPKIEYVHA